MSETSPAPSYITRNGLMVAYTLLKDKLGRFHDNTHISPLEDFYEKVGRSLGFYLQQYTLTYGEVEQFYTGQTSETNFIATIESRLIRAANSPVGSPVTSNVYSLGDATMTTGHPGLTAAELKVLSVIWDMYSVQPELNSVCSKIPKVCGLCMWELFLCLDKDSQQVVSVLDVYELVNLIFKANGHTLELTTVQEWFCNETAVDFRCFLQSLVEGYAGLMQTKTIQDLYTTVCLKQLKQGRMMKKGHVVHNWKWRWFILTTADIKYYESQDNLISKGCINITANSQVQIMAETKGHPYKFRVVDGISGTATEISCPDEQMRREWMDTIRLAIKLKTTDGRNFVHQYVQALESMPKATARGMVVKKLKDGTTSVSPTTSPTHKPLSPSKSVPLDAVYPPKSNGRGRLPLPATPGGQKGLKGSTAAIDEHRQLAPQLPDYEDVDLAEAPPPIRSHRVDSSEAPPPVPPQRLDTGDIRELQLNRQTLDEYNVDGGQRLSKSPKSSLRRTSSAGELQDSIKHLQVGEGEYALVSKVPKKTKKTSAPAAPLGPGDRNAERPKTPSHVPPPITKKKSPPMPFQNKNKQQRQLSDERENGRNTPPTVSVKPDKNGMSYAELHFSPGDGGGVGGGEYETTSILVSKPKASNSQCAEVSPIVGHDPKTKYGYSTILFDTEKQKDILAAEKLKKERGAPPPVPGRYQGEALKAKKLRQYLSDSCTTTASLPVNSKEQKFQGKARPISAGANRSPATTAASSQNGRGSASPYGVYEEYGFDEEEEEFDNVPRKPKSNGEVSRNQRVADSDSRQKPSGYENVDLDNDRLSKVDRQNQPLPPLPPSNHYQGGTTSPMPPSRSPVAARPSHLYQQQSSRTGNGSAVQYPSPTAAPPQPKPRITPRKGASTPTNSTPPVPPRKIS